MGGLEGGVAVLQLLGFAREGAAGDALVLPADKARVAPPRRAWRHGRASFGPYRLRRVERAQAGGRLGCTCEAQERAFAGPSRAGPCRARQRCALGSARGGCFFCEMGARMRSNGGLWGGQVDLEQLRGAGGLLNDAITNPFFGAL